MTRLRFTPALRETGFIVALLLLTLVLSAVLLYEAYAAIQSQSRTSGRALQDYAAVGAWELSREAPALLERRWSEALAAADVAMPETTRPEPPADAAAAFAKAVAPELRACGCDAGVVGYFAMTPAGAIALDGGAKLLPAAWADDVLRPAIRGRGPARIVSPELRVQAVRAGPRRLVVAYADAPGGAGTVHGWIADPVQVAPHVLLEVLRTRPLLPPALIGGGGGADMLSVVATGPAGDTAYAWPPASPGVARTWLRPYDERVSVLDTFPRTPAVRQALGGALAGITLEVSLRPERAGQLAIQSSGSGRLPLLLGAFCLNLLLFAVAVAQLRRQHELARLRSDFVSGVSHELRTPLAQIRLFAELLETGRLSAPQRERSIRVIQRDARRLTYLVENILRFARSERGGQRITPAWTPVAPLVREIVHDFAFLAPETALEMELDEAAEARLDAEAFRQVLLNLLENAAKYGPRGQAVTVGACRVDGRLEVWVDDAGPGIPPADRTRVWQAYHRLERDAGSATGGSGIGLSIVQRLVRLHGGDASIGDSPAGGARVLATFPDARPLAAERASGDASAADAETPATSRVGR
ncbi:MAG TPA: HAMP domain-containing sensor histidine kinase [Longimicrobiaceae bacterium]|nr:HAMP domain-containing sensor histidine kinase [Longimicrobiaceae bacterium]